MFSTTRTACLAILSLALLAIAQPAAHGQNRDPCADGSNDSIIAGCTAIIKSGRASGRDLVSAYRNRGLAYRFKRDFDHSLADYNEAIRLEPQAAQRYWDRGLVYGDMGDADRAIADYSQALRLDPQFTFGYLSRGYAYFIAGDREHAIADYNEAIRLRSDFAATYRNRGLVLLYGGDLRNAFADLDRATQLAPQDALMALWRDIAAQRSGIPSKLADAIGQIDMGAWPAPVLRLYLGQLTPDALRAAANDPDPINNQKRVCQANFYNGVWQLRQGAKPEAIIMFRLAANGCPPWFLERISAVAELKALGVAP